jgi:hypothetical protein
MLTNPDRNRWYSFMEDAVAHNAATRERLYLLREQLYMARQQLRESYTLLASVNRQMRGQDALS